MRVGAGYTRRQRKLTRIFAGAIHALYPPLQGPMSALWDVRLNADDADWTSVHPGRPRHIVPDGSSVPLLSVDSGYFNDWEVYQNNSSDTGMELATTTPLLSGLGATPSIWLVGRYTTAPVTAANGTLAQLHNGSYSCPQIRKEPGTDRVRAVVGSGFVEFDWTLDQATHVWCAGLDGSGNIWASIDGAAPTTEFIGVGAEEACGLINAAFLSDFSIAALGVRTRVWTQQELTDTYLHYKDAFGA